MNARTFLSTRLLLSLTLIVVGTAGCEESDTGASGGGAGGGSSSTEGGGGGGESVLGTTQDRDCDTVEDFAAACAEEGGLLEDGCQGTTCAGSVGRPGATCFAPPPAPSPTEFSCDGLFNCAVGEMCQVFEPLADGCFAHTCEPFPSGCVEDPTCECLLTQERAVSCEEDEDGNPTFRIRG